MNELDFEASVSSLKKKISELQVLSKNSDMSLESEIQILQTKADKMLSDIYSNLTPWQVVQIARHHSRPHASAYIDALFKDIFYLHGDRINLDDESILMGLAKYHDQTVLFIGQEKGRDHESHAKYNFGMTKPAGYRKIMRGLNLAEKFNMPVISFVDTPGADAGIESEKEGQAYSIAKCIQANLQLTVPHVSVIIGEGGSGGAMAVNVADVVLMLKYAICSVASPEASSSILWKKADHKVEASNALKLTSQDLLKTGYAHEIIEEPIGAAHHYADQVIKNVDVAIKKHLDKLVAQSTEDRIKSKHERYATFGM